MGVFWIGLRGLFLPDYARMEREAAERDVERVVNALQSEMDNVGASAADWALWDDAYDYMHGADNDFPQENFTDPVLTQVGLDLVLLVGPDGAVRDARWRDGEAVSAQGSPPDAVTRSFLAHQSLRPPVGGGTGIVDAPDGRYLAASRPITRADGSGDSAGVMILGLRLDRRLEARLTRRLRQSFTIETREEPLASAGEPVAVVIGEDGRTLLATAPLFDPEGAPTTTVRLVQPRTLYLQGERLMDVLLGVGGLTMALMLSLVGGLAGRLNSADLERQRASALYTFLAGQSSDGVVLAGDDGRVRHSSGAAAILLGRERPEDLVGVPLAALFGDDAARAQPGSAPLVVVQHGTRGARRHLELSVSRVDLSGATFRSVAIRDVSDRVRDEERMRFLAFHDALTGLPNRILFQDRLAQALSVAERRGAGLAVAFLDLDHFKSVNDAVGHDQADAMLVELARRVRAVLRPSDTLARQGGDEFLLLLPGLGDAESARGVCERLLDAVRVPIRVGGRDLGVSASIGVALYPADGRDSTTLVKNADLAMYKAKQSGRNVWQLVDSSLHDRLARIADLRARLMRAVENDELVLHYQPQVDPRSGRVVALEALVRWQPPGEPLVPPGVFIPVAEETGLIVAIGEWVIRRACDQLHAWRAAHLDVVRVGVNVSALHFAQPGLARFVQEALTAAHLDASLLEIEITESVAMANPDVVRTVLEELVASGVGVALDDFGTGHSSLAALRSLPFDRLKIDRGFLSHIDEDSADRAVVAAIVALAHALRIGVVAEGVERSAQQAILADLGCDLLQGYGLYRPAPAEDIAELLGSQRAARMREVH